MPQLSKSALAAAAGKLAALYTAEIINLNEKADLIKILRLDDFETILQKLNEFPNHAAADEVKKTILK